MTNRRRAVRPAPALSGPAPAPVLSGPAPAPVLSGPPIALTRRRHIDLVRVAGVCCR
ncbi:putative leader peptide [Streptomyces sp. NPDC020807]|uniref:putative leader peptide n=1 Tax=Streptomyces sp. NPDC020807 TaxID=3155119 RepID=UPI0033F56226